MSPHRRTIRRPSMAKTRSETDSMGEVAVLADRYWGAQTQRSLDNFRIGTERMPEPLIRAFGIQKTAAARANLTLGAPDRRNGATTVPAPTEVAEGKHHDPLPL